MRDLVRLIQSAALQAELAGKHSIEEPEAKRVLNELRRQLMAQLTPDYHEILQRVRDTRQRIGGDGAEKCDLMLRNDIVLARIIHTSFFQRHSCRKMRKPIDRKVRTTCFPRSV